MFKPHALEGRKAAQTVLFGYTAILDDLLKKGITNSVVCLERLQAVGFPGGLTTVKGYIAAHKHLIPAKHQLVAPQSSQAIGSLQGQERPTRWTEASPRFWITTAANTTLPVLPWSATTAVSGMWSFFRTQSRRTCSVA